MNIYRTSIWKSEISWFLKSTLVSCFILIIILSPFLKDIFEPTKLEGRFKEVLILISIFGFFLPLLSGFIFSFYYVIVYEDRVVIKNAILPFFNWKYNFCEITQLEIGNLGGYLENHIRIIRGNKKSFRYVIGLVNPKDYRKLLNEFRKYNIEIIISGKLNNINHEDI